MDQRLRPQGRGNYRGYRPHNPGQTYVQRGGYQPNNYGYNWNGQELYIPSNHYNPHGNNIEVWGQPVPQSRWLPRPQGYPAHVPEGHTNIEVQSQVSPQSHSNPKWLPKGQTYAEPLASEASGGAGAAARKEASYRGVNFGFAKVQYLATFYPKFENEKSDQEIRMKMIEVVQSGKGVLEVSFKHSGSLFMYGGHIGGAFAKNSFGNLYTAVGLFVLGRTFEETWGSQAAQKQREFNSYLDTNHICISMELVTAVLGDHGQRPKHDYVVVTAIADLKNKPRFFSTPEIVAFCREWRLPTNSVWLFSSGKSAISFFTTYDALCEEGTAHAVSKTLDEISDVSIPGTKDHSEFQGEILEGLVARIVTPQSTEKMRKVLEDHPIKCDELDKTNPLKSLREICAKHRSSEKEQVKALLESVGPDMCSDWSDWTSNQTDGSLLKKLMKAVPANQMTQKLQEMIQFLQGRNLQVRYPCRVKEYNTKEQMLHFKLTIHVLRDSVFRIYQKEMKKNPHLWPLFRGFFVDVYLSPLRNRGQVHVNSLSDSMGSSLHLDDILADEAENLMLKLKFLPYKIRTFLIRNGLSTLFQKGFPDYRRYYLRQMEIWNTSNDKQRQLDKLLTEWAQYITSKYRERGPNERMYLSEAEPFLENFAKRSLLNQRLVGFAGTTIRTEDFLSDFTDENEFSPHPVSPMSPLETRKISPDNKRKGVIVFFPAIPGCGKSALCKELLNNPGALTNDRTMHTLMGDLVKGRYWDILIDERRKFSPTSIMLADKNAPNVEVWEKIETMCLSSNALGIPVVPASEGTDSNPFSLEALALFMYRVLQRVNHPGNLDKNSPNAGYVLLMFYHLYEGKDREEFDDELKRRFGYVVKIPVLSKNRPNMPQTINKVIMDGIKLFKRHTERHGKKKDSTQGEFRTEWSNWEKELRAVLNGNSEYFKAVQFPFAEAVESLRAQLLAILRGDMPREIGTDQQRSFRNITYAALVLPGKQVFDILQKISQSNGDLQMYFNGKDIEKIVRVSPHITLAHKASHGVAAVAAFGKIRGMSVPVELRAFLYSSKMCALEAKILENSKGISSKNDWPHATIWTAPGTKAKEANSLPQLVMKGVAYRVDFARPIVLSSVLELMQ